MSRSPSPVRHRYKHYGEEPAFTFQHWLEPLFVSVFRIASLRQSILGCSEGWSHCMHIEIIFHRDDIVYVYMYIANLVIFVCFVGT